jgi:hypothetical protein
MGANRSDVRRQRGSRDIQNVDFSRMASLSPISRAVVGLSIAAVACAGGFWACGSGSGGSNGVAGDSGMTDGARLDVANADGPASASDAGPPFVFDAAAVDAPFCVEWDASPDGAPYLDLRVDGVPLQAGQVRVGMDINGEVVVSAGYPSFTFSNTTRGEGLTVLFPPAAAGTSACDQSDPTRNHEVSFEYQVGAGTVTGANSELGMGPCSMTVVAAADAGLVQGRAAGRLYNVTPDYQQTFDFETCWKLPYPYDGGL